MNVLFLNPLTSIFFVSVPYHLLAESVQADSFT